MARFALTIFSRARIGQMVQSFRNIKNLAIKFIRLGTLVSVTLFNISRVSITGRLCIGPTKLPNILSLWAFIPALTIFIRRNRTVKTNLRDITRSMVLARVKLATVVLFSSIQFTRLTESQVITCPTLPRVTVAIVLQSISIVVYIVRQGDSLV